MTVARTISRSASAVIEQLELDGDLLVTTGRIADVMRLVGLHGDEGKARRVAYELQRDGWLGQLHTRNAWEFLPGARGGAYGSGDRFIEFRAQRAANPDWPGILAMESAASVLGLAQRIPEREVVAIGGRHAMPKSLAGEWRSVGVEISELGLTTVNDLPTWNREGLIVGIASRPSGYKDVAGLGQWLSEIPNRLAVDVVIELLEAERPTTRQRAAYLLGAAGDVAARTAIMKVYPAKEAAWLGPRVAGAGVFNSATQVNDTLLHPYLGVGIGS